jgi:hypothetical protein
VHERLAPVDEIIYRTFMPQRFSNLLDKSAMTLSGLCLVHCLAGTLLLTLFAASSELFSHNVHLIGLALALPLAVVALWRGVSAHGRIGVAILGAGGIGLMAASLMIGHGGSGEILLSVAGVGLLGMAHFWNLRASRA